MPRSKRSSAWIDTAVYGAGALQMGTMVALGILGGNALDQRWHTSPWLGLSGLILGAVVGFYQLFKIMLWKQKRHERKSRTP